MHFFIALIIDALSNTISPCSCHDDLSSRADGNYYALSPDVFCSYNAASTFNFDLIYGLSRVLCALLVVVAIF